MRPETPPRVAALLQSVMIVLPDGGGRPLIGRADPSWGTIQGFIPVGIGVCLVVVHTPDDIAPIPAGPHHGFCRAAIMPSRRQREKIA
jgi:hypothetical protein